MAVARSVRLRDTIIWHWACQAISVLQTQHAIRSAEFHASQDTRKMRDMSEVTHFQKFQLSTRSVSRASPMIDQSTDKTRLKGHQDVKYLRVMSRVQHTKWCLWTLERAVDEKFAIG
ncbi:hypothetical protein E4U56_001531 [Claviceps arundinis]|uniref:Uncharacterized protein n=1 Tax=Claviceps arundinis TaxID=1623583 RepID=A0A9P7MS37_9HYPO|nr:hypothetical protein E4U56_001531 [Claviceps arundinis]